MHAEAIRVVAWGVVVLLVLPAVSMAIVHAFDRRWRHR